MENAKNGSDLNNQNYGVLLHQGTIEDGYYATEHQMQKAWESIEERIIELEREEHRKSQEKRRNLGAVALRKLRQIINNVRHLPHDSNQESNQNT